MSRFADELLRERRSERRWRVFFRLAWLLLVVLIAWSLFAARGHTTAPSGPHTALIEVRGEIDAESEASAENLVAALKARSRTPARRPWCCASTARAAARCRPASSTTRSGA